MKNIIWIDWARCICMLFVYWLHVGMFSSAPIEFPISYGPFFVNAFFFISGYLLYKKLKNDNNKSTRANTAKGVLFKICIPSIIFSSFDFFPKSMISGTGVSFGAFLMNVIVQGTQWFTCALAISEIIILMCFIFLKRTNVWILVAISLGFASIGWSLTCAEFSILGNSYLPWFYKSGFMATLFLAVGGVYYEYEKTIDNIIRKNIIIPLTLLIIYLVTTVVFKGMFRCSVLTGINFVGLLLSLYSIILLITLCKYLKRIHIVEYISRHTIAFYFLSASVPFICNKIVDSFLLLGETPVIGFLVKYLLSLLLAITIVFLLYKYCAFLFDLRKLKKKK